MSTPDPAARRTSGSSVISFATEYSYKEDGGTPIERAYDEAEALAIAIAESERDAVYDRIALAMTQIKIQDDGTVNGGESTVGADADDINDRAPLTNVAENGATLHNTRIPKKRLAVTKT